MKIYDYDKNTGEYLGEREAVLDPLEAEKGNLVPLVPAFATLVAPPIVSAGYVAVYEGGWVVKEDHRGKTVYSADGTQKVIACIGSIPSGWSLSPILPTADDVVDLVRAVRDKMLDASDWTDLPHAQLTTAEAAEWQQCRQDLRDCPDILTGAFFYNVLTDAEKLAWRNPTPNMIMDLMGREPWA